MFIILSGSSGVGKNTVMNELFARNKKIKPFVSYTTRNMREGEKDGVNYHYVTKEQFQELRNKGKFCEVEEIHSNFYGSNFDDIYSGLSGENIVIKDIGVEGAINLRRLFKNNDNVVTIFLTAPKDVLIERLQNRGEQQIELRMKRYDYEHTFLNQYDYVINNDNLENTIAKIFEIIDKHNYKIQNKEQKKTKVDALSL